MSSIQGYSGVFNNLQRYRRHSGLHAGIFRSLQRYPEHSMAVCMGPDLMSLHMHSEKERKALLKCILEGQMVASMQRYARVCWSTCIGSYDVMFSIFGMFV